jgi:hypothetical protein
MKTVLPLISAVSLCVIAGCTLTANMYPINKAAEETGPLEAKYFPTSGGNANVTVQMPDGEILKGQFTLIEGPTANFGSIMAAEGKTSALSVSGGSASSGKYPGVGTLIGDRGTKMECEFYRSSFGGGVGACQSSSGGLYRLHMAR